MNLPPLRNLGLAWNSEAMRLHQGVAEASGFIGRKTRAGLDYTTGVGPRMEKL